MLVCENAEIERLLERDRNGENMLMSRCFVGVLLHVLARAITAPKDCVYETGLGKACLSYDALLAIS